MKMIEPDMEPDVGTAPPAGERGPQRPDQQPDRHRALRESLIAVVLVAAVFLVNGLLTLLLLELFGWIEELEAGAAAALAALLPRHARRLHAETGRVADLCSAWPRW